MYELESVPVISLDTIETIRVVIVLVLAYLIVSSIAGAFQAWVADKAGDDTARSLGFATLNPFFHVDPMSLILIPVGYLIFGVVIGLGKPLPIVWHHITAPWRWFKLTMVSCAQPLAMFIALFMLVVVRLLALWGLIVLGQSTWLPVATMVSSLLLLAVQGFAAWFIPYHVLLSVVQFYAYEQESRGMASNYTLLVLLVPLFGALLLHDAAYTLVVYSVGGMTWGLHTLFGLVY